MMAAEIATAQITSSTVCLDLVGAPDEHHDGQPFIVERARLSTYLALEGDRLVPYVSVEGRAIRIDGTIGQQIRRRTYSLSPGNLHPAPTWLVEALKAAGVTW